MNEHEPARTDENPEAGEALANGAVAECDCEDCLAKYEEAELR
jgi:hypothetical protein